MNFLESDGSWGPIPKWADFFVNFGHKWRSHHQTSTERNITIISMPFDTPGAGLVALGALISDLGNSRANDIDGHYDAMLRYAQQYVQHCRSCELPSCNPSIKNCGFVERASGRIRSQSQPRKIYSISDRTDFEKGQLAWETSGTGKHGNATIFPNRSNLNDWHLQEESPVEIGSAEGQLDAQPYEALISPNAVLQENLTRSFSGLCYSGRVMGKSETLKVCDSICFENNGRSYRLSELLTVIGWNKSNGISRLSYFNPRTQKFDRVNTVPNLVVADGDISLLRTLDEVSFQRSHVIGVIHRTIERERLEEIGHKISVLRNWYGEDPSFSDHLDNVPKGIGILSLKKRTG